MTLYVNKQGCSEFILSHKDIIFEKIASNPLASSFFSVLMNGSTIHTKEKQAVYVHHFQKDMFLKAGEPVQTILLMLQNHKWHQRKLNNFIEKSGKFG